MSNPNGNGTSARSGAGGQAYINGRYVVRLKQWSVSVTASESAWGDSDALGFTNRKLARKDCTGSLTGVQQHSNANTQDIYQIISGSTNSRTPLAGRVTSLELWEDNFYAGDSWYFPSVLIQNFNITYDMDTMEVVEWTMDFAADGLFFRPYETPCTGERGGYTVRQC